jgi:Domain of unknown function (DUF4169)
MSAEIVNLRRARKARARAEKEDKAAENRRRHGRSKAEKQAESAERERAGRHVESHRRQPDED